MNEELIKAFLDKKMFLRLWKLVMMRAWTCLSHKEGFSETKHESFGRRKRERGKVESLS